MDKNVILSDSEESIPNWLNEEIFAPKRLFPDLS